MTSGLRNHPGRLRACWWERPTVCSCPRAWSVPWLSVTLMELRTALLWADLKWGERWADRKAELSATGMAGKRAVSLAVAMAAVWAAKMAGSWAACWVGMTAGETVEKKAVASVETSDWWAVTRAGKTVAPKAATREQRSAEVMVAAKVA